MFYTTTVAALDTKAEFATALADSWGGKQENCDPDCEDYDDLSAADLVVACSEAECAERPELCLNSSTFCVNTGNRTQTLVPPLEVRCVLARHPPPATYPCPSQDSLKSRRRGSSIG